MPFSNATPAALQSGVVRCAEMIGDARLLALSEAVHGAAQPLEFRNRVFKYLVEVCGFTAIAIESGSVESRTVHNYVRGGPGKLSDILAEGITWTFDKLPQNRELVRWLRNHNADPQHVRKINFYGFDLVGSPADAGEEDARDRAQADRIEWILNQEGPDGRVLVFAHTYHVSTTAAFRTRSLPNGTVKCRQHPAGTYLKERFGKQLVTIGNLIGTGEVRCGDYHQTLGRSSPDSWAALTARVGAPFLLLDLRQAPPDLARWFERECLIGQGDDAMALAPGKAFDVLLYIDVVTPACHD